ncbi:MAG: peptidylprolyl isomerase [Campylobacteraceae bacterium]|jgi:peptidylprolyl isomerase|nr:peptidylprolyl isomerase [Campylobacteraceae bacterium]
MRKLIVGALALFFAVHVNAAVIATVNGQDITDEDANIVLRQLAGDGGVKYDAIPDELKKQIIDRIVEEKLLINNAIKSGIEKDPEYIKTLAQVKGQIALQAWIGKEIEKIKVTDEQIKKYYDDNVAKFPLKPATWQVSHILVKDEATAKKVVKELTGVKDLPAKFKEAVNKYSEDNASKASGGSLGAITKETPFVKEFLDAVFTLKKGEISKAPVKTVYGYHIIYVTDKTAESKYTLDEVKSKLAIEIRNTEFQNSVKAQAKALKDKAKIVIK